MSTTTAPIQTSTTKVNRDRFVSWDESDRESAFELWFTNGRPSIAQVVRIVQAELNKDIPHETIRGWYHKHQWDVDADRRLAALAPNMMIRTALSLTVAGVRASKMVEDMWTPDSGVPFDRDKHAAALAVCAALGFSPGSKSRPAIALPSDTDDHVATDAADALARITARRERSGR